MKPNGVYVESIIKQVTEVLESNGHGRKVDGYQSNSRERPYLMAAALWSVIAQQKIAYVSVPPSFARQGQLVRLASNISSNKMGACLGLSAQSSHDVRGDAKADIRGWCCFPIVGTSNYYQNI